MLYISSKAAISVELFLDIFQITGDKHHPAASVGAGLDHKGEGCLVENILKDTLHTISDEKSLSIEIEYQDAASSKPGFCLADAFLGIDIVIQPGIGH